MAKLDAWIASFDQEFPDLAPSVPRDQVPGLVVNHGALFRGVLPSDVTEGDELYPTPLSPAEVSPLVYSPVRVRVSHDSTQDFLDRTASGDDLPPISQVDLAVFRTTRSAEERLLAVADRSNPSPVDRIAYVNEREAATDEFLAYARLIAVNDLLIQHGITGARMPDIEITAPSMDSQTKMRTRFRYLGSGVVGRSLVVAMAKRITQVKDMRVLGFEEEVLALNAYRGVNAIDTAALPRGVVIPTKTIMKFRQYVDIAYHDRIR
jgi:hypothetical protein